jgi:hypothetical protein
LIIIIFFLLQVFCTSCEWNLVRKLIDFIDNNPSETTRYWLMGLNFTLLGSLIPMGKLCINRLFSKNKRKEKEQKIIYNLPQEYK